jgi:hypothetical protein
MTEDEAAEIVDVLHQAGLNLAQSFTRIREELMRRLLTDEAGPVSSRAVIEVVDDEVRKIAGECQRFRAYLKGWSAKGK